MKRKLQFVFGFLFFSFKSFAFLCGTTVANPTATITPSAVWQTVVCTSGAVRYIEFVATTGNTYSFTTLTNVGGSCTADEQFSIQTTGGAASGGTYSTSFVDVYNAGFHEYFDWSPSSNGTYRIVISKYSAADCVNLSANLTMAYITFAATSNFSFWTARTDDHWNLIDNWRTSVGGVYPTEAVPTSSYDVIIADGSSIEPTIYSSEIASTRNLTINSGVTLVNAATAAGAGYLDVFGSFTNNGTYNHSGDVYSYMEGVGKTIGGTGTFTTASVYFWSGSTTTLSTNLSLSDIRLHNSVGTVLNLSTFYLTATNSIQQDAGTLNFNSGTLEVQCLVTNPTATSWNCGTGLFYENLAAGGPFSWLTGFTFYDFTVNTPGTTYSTGGTLTVTRNLTIAAGTFDIAATTLNVGGNFTNNGTFSATTGTVNLNGSAAQTLGGSSASTFYNLILNNTAGITFGRNATVANGGTLTLTAGYHDLASYTLQVGTTAATTLTYTAGGLYSSTDNGSFKRYVPTGAVASTGGVNYGLFPFKKSATSLNFFELNSTANVTTAGFITATPKFANTILDVTDYSDGNGTVTKVKSGKAIDVVLTTIAGGTFSLKLSSGTFAAGTLTDYTLVTYTGPGVVASYKGTFAASTGSGTLPVLNRTGVATADLANGWVVGTYNFGATTLPIEIVSFTGEKIDKNNELKWTTASELNNDFFTVERTNDGSSFEIIGTYNGAGNSTELSNYFLIDYNVRPFINYYRLKQTDFDGHSTFSEIIAIDNTVVETSKEIILKTDILGQEVNEQYRGLVIIFYANGTSIKVIQ